MKVKNLIAALGGAVIAAALVVGLSASAKTTFSGGHPFEYLGTLVNAGTLDSNQTFTLTGNQYAGYGVLALYFDHGNTAATDIGIACTVSVGGVDFPLQSTEVSSGVGTSYDASWLKAVTGDDEWVWRVDVHGLAGSDSVTCTTSDTSGAGSDTLSIYGTLTSQ